MNLDIVNEKKFILADGHIFKTVNGEGYFLGVPSIFIRFAGCSVGCKFCDTKYGVDKIEFTIEEIVKKYKRWNREIKEKKTENIQSELFDVY